MRLAVVILVVTAGFAVAQNQASAALKSAAVDSKGDHRLAMTAFVAGFLAGGESRIEGAACAEICEACAESCDRIGGKEMESCAEACRRCAQSCREMSKMKKAA